MLGCAFEQWGVRRVVLKTHGLNTRSQTAIERIGGRLDGRTTSWSPDGEPRISVWYSLLASRWPEIESSLRAKLESHPVR